MRGGGGIGGQRPRRERVEPEGRGGGGGGVKKFSGCFGVVCFPRETRSILTTRRCDYFNAPQRCKISQFFLKFFGSRISGFYDLRA